MVVTRSTVLSQQAKLGLPRGNQIIGLFTLGGCLTGCSLMMKKLQFAHT